MSYWFSCLFSSEEYLLYILTIYLIYLLLAQSLNLVVGLGGLFSLSHIACFSIGAYVTAILATRSDFTMVPLLLLSGVGASVLALFVASMSLRLTEDYFAIGTLAFALMINAILTNWTSFTGGVLGIPGIPTPVVLGKEFESPLSFFALTATCVIPLMLFLFLIWRSHTARALRASSEFELGASACGYDIPRLRTFSVSVSAFCAGVAGCLFAYLLKFIDPTSFSLQEMVLILSMVILGKPGSFWGVACSTLFLIVLPEGLRCIDYLQNFPGILGPMRQFIYAFLLFLMVFVFRDKLFPTQRKI